MLEKAAIFALTTNVEMAQKVVNYIGVPLSQCEVKHFKDGEIIVEIPESVRGKNVYVIQSTCNPATEKLMELLIFVDALKRASAMSITVITPYYGYSRQDRKARAREPITARLVADMLEVAGIDRIVTLDLHAPQIQGFFSVPADDLSAIPLFARHLTKFIEGKDVVVVSPDHGGVTRARKLANMINAPIAIIDKRRPKPNVAEVMNIIGEVKGKTAIIIDDIADTAGTIIAGAEAIKNQGATEVYAVCSHGILSNPARENIEKSCIKQMIITDSIPLAPENNCDKISVVSIAPMLAKVIEHIELGKPLSIVYDLYNKN
jgi:ribose-phosphate pyrophosphokinase